MTTRYQLPEGSTSASVDGIHFEADENGHIDVTGAHPTTVAQLVQYTGARPVRSEEQLAQDVADIAEGVRFRAAVAAMMAEQAAAATAKVDALRDQRDADAAAEAAAKEAGTASHAEAAAIIASAPVEAVTPPGPDDSEPSDVADMTGNRSVMPPRRRR
ncbi:MAG: hypothetical protein ACRYG8_06635 [Janthinobacterium lividum]